MPTDTIIITRWWPSPTRVPGLTQYLLEGEADTPPYLRQYVSLSDWAGSLWKEAHGCTADVTWKDSRYGKQVVAVEVIAKREASQGDAA